MTQDLVAEGDRVVVEASVDVADNRALVIIHRVGDVPLTEHQVAYPVEERNVQLGCVLIEVIEKLDVHSERFREILLEL